jgi:arylsulfatase A-like enzyme
VAARGLTRRQILQAGGAGAAGIAAASLGACASDDFEPANSHDPDAPNTMLIVAESTRADYLSPYNENTIADTPNIDALAKDSLVFNWAVPDAMPTGPVRRAILTGVRSFPYRNWVQTEGLPGEPGWNPIYDYQPIFTETMGEAGITTAYVTDNPFLVGPRFANFRRTLDYARPDYSQGAYRFLNKPLKRPAPRSAVERYLLPALSDSVEVPRLRDFIGWNALYRRREADFSSARVMRGAMKIVPDLAERQPFFLGVDAFDPHEAFDPPPIYMERFGTDPKGIERDGIKPIQPFETPYSWLVDLEIDDETVERVRELYAAEITYTDKWLGRLLNKMDDEGVLDNTAIYYTADHGLTLGERGLIGKHAARVRNEMYHVPLMIRHPEGKLAGQRSDFYAGTHDVARTLLGFQGVRAPGQMNGEDLSVLFDGKEPPSRDYFTSCYARYVICGDERYTFVAHSELDAGRIRLFDRENDPDEERDISADNPELVTKFVNVLAEEAGGTLPQFGENGVLGG